MSSDGNKGGGGAPWRSASAIVAKSVTGSHDLKIKGYSLTKRLGNGKFIESEAFAVGGHRWCLRYYPNGCCSSDAGRVSFILFLDDSDDGSELTAQFKVSLLGHDGKLVEGWYSTGPRNIFSKKLAPKDSYGLITTNELEKSVYLKDDVFSVRCDLTVVSIFGELAMPDDVPVPPSDMQLHFGQLLADGEGTDVTLEEKTDACVRIKDMEATVFKAMLHFIYTDSLPHVEERDDAVVMAQHLLAVADRYNLQKLKSICEGTLCRFMDTTTTATTLALAEQHACPGLKQACFNFLRSPGNLKAVMASDGFGHLMKSCPSFHKELAENLF
ncbi:unnamed protein product [Alopecurus aequalis]